MSNTNEIEDKIIQSLCDRQFPIFLTKYDGRGMSEIDVLGIGNNGYMYEFEIKISRSDFLAEFKNKKTKHNNLKNRNCIYKYNEWVNGKKTDNIIEHIIIPNRYYFVCPEYLISEHEIPEYAGLIYISEIGYYEVKNAKLLHRNKANIHIYQRISTILSQRIIYGCSYYTYKNKTKEDE